MIGNLINRLEFENP